MSDTSSGEKSPRIHSANGHFTLRVQARCRTNWRDNSANQWYKDGADPADAAGPYAFQRLRQTWFTPKIDPKFKLRRDDKFYAIGSCFARGLEFALQVAKCLSRVRRLSSHGSFRSKKSEQESVSSTSTITFSILNELRWALDPAAVFPVESIAKVTETTGLIRTQIQRWSSLVSKKL